MVSVAPTVPSGDGRLIVVFGATGATGSELVKLALANGFRVRAFARSVEKAETKLGGHALLEIAQGTFQEGDKVKAAISDADVIFVTAGAGMNSSNNYPTFFMRDLVETIVESMGPSQKIVYQAGAFSPPPCGKNDCMTAMMAAVFGYMLGIGKMVEDNNAVIDVLSKCDKNWIVTRPGMIAEGESMGTLVGAQKMSGSIKFIDLANWTLRIAYDEAHLRTSPIPVYHR